MRDRRLLCLTFFLPLIAGCSAVPMTYAEWKKETEDRLAFQRAGLQYKSPEELREEAAAMRQTVDATTFPGK